MTAQKAGLSRRRGGTVVNLKSKVQETALAGALEYVVARLQREFDVTLRHEKRWQLARIVEQLERDFPDVSFHEPHKNRWLEPDGGVLSIVDRDLTPHVILISEVKNQGTNDERAAAGMSKQAMGNAIERLGKNMIGFRTAMLAEGIMPFVCFGYGCDFKDGSYVLDRVRTIAMFGPMNDVCLMNEGQDGRFNRGSFFFREKEWTHGQMSKVMYQIASRSIHYYFAKLGPEAFAPEG
jgi:type II restriction enzyme